jgi:cysteine desulfurase/selenocysteine lyase
MTTVAKIPPAESANSRPQLVETKFDVEKIRRDFPILSRDVRGKKLVYLDNAATSQKPRVVIDAISRYYEEGNANIHRGVHFLSEHATGEHERARKLVQKFINARDVSEVIFVRGTTEAINLVAQTYGRKHVGKGDEVLITAMEHHSNIVPWQMLCEEKGAKLRVAPINDRGELILPEFEKLLGPRTKIVAVAHVSNALGTVNPLAKIVALAHQKNIPVLVDGAQAVPHMKVDVRALGCDFYALSGHKMFGPLGIGVLYGQAELLEEMPPYQGGGDMISSVTFEKTLYNKLPYKFEAGTPDIAEAIALGAAIEYLNSIGMGNIERYEHDLVAYAIAKLASIAGVRLIGTPKERAGVVSFVIEGIHPHDIGTILDQEGIAIRTGHHCAQPIMQRFGIPATARASFAFYNTKEEVDALAQGILKVKEVFA